MTLQFTITFHGPFRIGGGAPVDGFDAPVNRSNPLPATSLKGLMRAEALERLMLPRAIVERVFGSPQAACPWVWSDAQLDSPQFGPSTKVRVDDNGHALRGFLRFGEQVWASQGSFTVEQRLPLSTDEQAAHRLVLTASAASITSLGESRLRGSGWVTIRGTEPATNVAEGLLDMVRSVAS